MLSDLRESGAIEQDADMVMFLYRPDYYGITEDEDNQDCRGIAEVIVAKNRHGALRTVKVRFVANFAKFVNLDTQFMELPQDYNNTITKGSRMNDPEDDNDNADNSTPF